MSRENVNMQGNAVAVEGKNFNMIYIVLALTASFYMIIMWILSSDNNARKELLKKNMDKHK